MHPSFFSDAIEYIRENKPDKDKLSREKVKLCAKHGLAYIPTDIEILMNAKPEELEFLKKYLHTKPTRTISGVAVVAIMTKPHACPHGKCAQCPGGMQSFFGDVPQSYTGKEPATLRAIRNNYDPYLQVFNRLEQYMVLGQNPDKVELIVMGGTFPSLETAYQEEFVYHAFKAMNDFSAMFFSNGEFDVEAFRDFFMLPGAVGDMARTSKIHERLLQQKDRDKKSLEAEQQQNETAAIRCIGMTIETRPDYATKEHANQLLKLGCTRVELGVQSVFDHALEKIERGHDVSASIEATRTLKDLGFKINYHMMLGMPGVNYVQDLDGLKQLFDRQEFRPDMLKLYPCMVLKGTKLYVDWQAGHYKPLTTEQAARLILDFKKHVPEYVRIMRVQRDIPTKVIDAGVDRTNLRQMVEELMNEHGYRCRCIRCREIKAKPIQGEPQLKVTEYEASGGTEFFIALEADDNILGFCRLRLPAQELREEIEPASALVRELHVYGSAAAIGAGGKVQHKGFGRILLAEAERTAKEHSRKKIIVISGIGVREYYRRLGYQKEGPYMVKYLQ